MRRFSTTHQRNVLETIEQRLGYSFHESALLMEAMTHRSFANESPVALPDNERLEFLGDAVLDLIVGEYLFKEMADLDEGTLTQARADVVAMPSLADLARVLNLGSGLLLGKGEERSGGRDKSNLLADALEAVIGAIFIDSGYETVRKVILPLFLARLQQALSHGDQDFKTRLQETLQARQKSLPAYVLKETSGPDHEPVYLVEALIEGDVYGAGRGRTKKSAEQAAARAALSKLEPNQ